MISQAPILGHLLQVLDASFDESELRTLVFYIGVDYDNLGGSSKLDKARELVAYCKRRKSISKLVEGIRQSRPDIIFPESELLSTIDQLLGPESPPHQNGLVKWLKNGWSIASCTIIIILALIIIFVRPSAISNLVHTPIAIATNTPDPTFTPAPTLDSTILYQANWSGGLGGWLGSRDWKAVSGMLVNDGTRDFYRLSITAPFAPDTVRDYAVEAEMKVIHAGDCSSFGLVARKSADGDGYQAGVTQCGSPVASIWEPSIIAEKAFDPGADWHTYRLEVKGNTIRFLIDGTLALAVTNNRHLSGGEAGLWNDQVELNVRSFKLVKLNE